ncbi:MAG: nicotinate-nucleotide--dimethylbenzimidazole phosphoribosyltransferase [Cryomorphaceae bacterium]|nr:nicotinate-nucleotide--dimethylbenzimidazole phosphoribosyltransferase [Cryomorphaceae bacterium]
MEDSLAPYTWTGRLCDLAVQLSTVLQTTKPELQEPALLVFTADHGFVESEEVDIGAMLSATSLISRSAKDAGLALRIVDAGLRAPMDNMVDYWIYRGTQFLPRKIQPGTKNVIHEAAMTTSECHAAIAAGASFIEQRYYAGSNAVALAGTGSGSLQAARMLVAVLNNQPLIRYVPTAEKRLVINKQMQRAINRHPLSHDVITNLTLYGGFETAMLTGAILQAAQRQMFVLLDGTPAIAAYTAAHLMHPEVKHYVCVAAHYNEPAFDRAQLPFVIDQVLHDGRGVGAAFAFPMVKQASRLLNS